MTMRIMADEGKKARTAKQFFAAWLLSPNGEDPQLAAETARNQRAARALIAKVLVRREKRKLSCRRKPLTHACT